MGSSAFARVALSADRPWPSRTRTPRVRRELEGGNVVHAMAHDENVGRHRCFVGLDGVIAQDRSLSCGEVAIRTGLGDHPVRIDLGVMRHHMFEKGSRVVAEPGAGEGTEDPHRRTSFIASLASDLQSCLRGSQLPASVAPDPRVGLRRSDRRTGVSFGSAHPIVPVTGLDLRLPVGQRILAPYAWR